jgi:C-terminal processing protease CtpA/Prc
LRGNPGGLLDIAVEMTDFWLDDGVIMTEAKADGTRKESHRDDGTACRRSSLPRRSCCGRWCVGQRQPRL